MHWYYTFQKSKGDIKQTWQNINNVLGRCKTKDSFPNVFKYNDQEYKTKQDIANGFNDYFVNVGPNLASKIPNTVNKPQTHQTTSLIAFS